MKLGSRAASLSTGKGAHQVRFDDGDIVVARTVIIATGAQYNRLDLDRLADCEGRGVYYAATQMEAQAHAGDAVLVVGGGNSAGQAALFLARTSALVHIIIRGESLAHSMSHYLIEQISSNPRIRLWPNTEGTALVGQQKLEGAVVHNNRNDTTSTLSMRGMFVFIGARPNTAWLAGQLAADQHGFILTGADIPVTRLERVDYAPLRLETSRPGVFCVGDVRSGSIKRVASAIGEGSMAVRLVFDHLRVLDPALTDQAPQP